MLLLLTLCNALALTSHQNGPAIDLLGGLGLRGTPMRPTIGALGAVGWWVGTYDDQYAFGRYWHFGVSTRLDWRKDALGITPMFEIRRGLELFVVGVSPFVAGGVILSVVPDPAVAPPLGFTARTGVNVKLRRTRFWGISLRLEGGADLVDGKVGAAGAALLGASFARPANAIRDPET